MNTDHRTEVPQHGRPSGDPEPVEHYEIRVRGQLGARWAAWFDGLTIAHEDDGTTVIGGPVVDQAALHGLLKKLRDLGVTLLSLTRIPPADAVEPPTPAQTRTRPETGAQP